MSLFDDLSEKLFPSNKKIDIQEVLKRTPKFMEDYHDWIQGDIFLALKPDLLKSWNYQFNNIRSPVNMSIYTSDYASGFIIYPMYVNSMIPLSFLMEFLKDRMLDHSYRLVHSGRTIKEVKEIIETQEMYHLKPPISNNLPIDQMYGNIHIELIKNDNKEIRLKFLASIYSDRKYSEARDFYDLVNVLFDN